MERIGGCVLFDQVLLIAWTFGDFLCLGHIFYKLIQILVFGKTRQIKC